VKHSLKDQRASLHTVSLKAAEASDVEFWTRARLEAVRKKGSHVSKLKPALRVFPRDFAGGLFPPRYGAPNK
jgi:hypothetical protein